MATTALVGRLQPDDVTRGTVPRPSGPQMATEAPASLPAATTRSLVIPPSIPTLFNAHLFTLNARLEQLIGRETISKIQRREYWTGDSTSNANV